jgi:hypothetical protein
MLRGVDALPAPEDVQSTLGAEAAVPSGVQA